MRKNITRIFTISMFILLALLAVVSSVFEVDFYKNAQSKYHVSDNMNLLVQDVDNATLVALLYTRGEVSELEYFVSINDQLVDLYSTQDKEHMIDVKNLYSFAYTVFISMFFVSITLLIVIFFMKIKAYEFFDIVNKTSVYLVGIIIVLALFAYINFDVFWTLFHKILFTNDLWYMNPHKDALVNLFPEQLFMDLVFKIIARFITFFASFNAGGLMYKKQALRGLKMINIVLYAPEIPSNTGNIMRTAMASNTNLILIRPLGFKLDDKYLKRSGMDYLKDVSYEVFDSFEDFEKHHKGKYFLISRYGKHLYSDANFKIEEDIYLIFGNESSGVSKEILAKYKENSLRIPMHKDARSLNLANSVALIVYEVLRQNDFFDLSKSEVIKGADFIDKF